MSVLVRNNIVLEGAVTVGGSVRPGVHAHLARLAIGGGSKVGVVSAGRVLNGNLNTVVLSTALAVVVLLEVVGRLVKAVAVLMG
jgi:hypothetical protein